MLSPELASVEARKICELAPVVPVLVVHEIAHARPLAEALVAGGLPALEVTLRTPVALDVIREMAKVEGGVVGAGSILTPKHVSQVLEAGAKFGVSPGSTDKVLTAAEEADLPMLPGAATASEVMALLERGYEVQKFFPAEIAGGAAAIKALGAPIPGVSFCPTGGVSMKNAMDYLSLSNILCVGGSWVAPQKLVDAGDWKAIEELAREAAALPR